MGLFVAEMARGGADPARVIGAATALGLAADATFRFSALLQELSTWSLTASRARLSLAAATGDAGAEARWRRRCADLVRHAGRLRLVHRGREVAVASVLAHLDLVAEPGHWRLRGANGAGKSTLLRQVAEHFGPRALLLTHALGPKFAQGPGSSAETMMGCLEEICAHSDAEIFCLDELDASLDAGNRGRFEALVARLAARGSVLEVSHRDTEGGPGR